MILNNGNDAQNVDRYAWGGAAAIERGWNALIFEGPGQGSVWFERGIPFRPDWEHVITPVVDYLRARPEVDPERIAAIGWSQGGELIARLDAGPQHPAVPAAECARTLDRHGERLALDLSQQRCELVGGAVVDVAGEAQRDVHVLGVDPLGARQRRADHRQPHADVGWHLDAGEQAGHCTSLSMRQPVVSARAR